MLLYIKWQHHVTISHLFSNNYVLLFLIMQSNWLSSDRTSAKYFVRSYVLYVAVLIFEAIGSVGRSSAVPLTTISIFWHFDNACWYKIKLGINSCFPVLNTYFLVSTRFFLYFLGLFYVVPRSNFSKFLMHGNNNHFWQHLVLPVITTSPFLFCIIIIMFSFFEKFFTYAI